MASSNSLCNIPPTNAPQAAAIPNLSIDFPPSHAAACRIVLVEPNLHLFKKLQKTVAGSNVPMFLFQGTLSEYTQLHSRERFDFVVSTLVMCSVDSLPVNLDIVKSVLSPNGSFVFIEHVADGAPDSNRARVQRTLEPLWHGLTGCHITRTTAHAILTQFGKADIEPFEHGAAPWLVQPHIRGIATLT
jgi:SAM-dependent methyltransferase